MTTDPLLPVRARSEQIKRLLADAKIRPDQLTAASLCYLAMKLLGVKGPDAEEFLSRGPFKTLTGLWEKLEAAGQNPAAAITPAGPYDPTDPDALVTLTQSQLWSMLGAGNKPSEGN